MRPHKERGIRQKSNGRITAYIRVDGRLYTKRFPSSTELDTVRRWRSDTKRDHLEARQGTPADRVLVLRKRFRSLCQEIDGLSSDVHRLHEMLEEGLTVLDQADESQLAVFLALYRKTSDKLARVNRLSGKCAKVFGALCEVRRAEKRAGP